MRKIFLLLLLLIVPYTASAATITTPVLFEIYSNTTYITIYNQTADFFNVSTTGHWLDIYINGTHLNFTTTTNKTLTGLSVYNNIINLTVNGTGVLTTTISTSYPYTIYNMYIDNIFTNNITTDANGSLAFNFTGDADTHNIMIIRGTPAPTFLENIQASKTTSCNGINSYSNIILPLFGLALMFLGFIVVISQIRNGFGGEAKIDSTIIISGILSIIIGFALLLLGNYILNVIFGVLC